MLNTDNWHAIGPDFESIFAQQPLPLQALAAGDVPAIVLRGVYSADWCHRLVGRLIGEGLLYDPKAPVPEEFRKLAIPEGYYREGRTAEARYAWESKTANGRTRIDIGTSLGYRGSDKNAFFAHSAETHRLFERLFTDESPVAQMYDCLERLSVDKRAVTAYEPDGRKYGPAIIRAHYGGYTYKPHFDSVRLREKRADYAVHEFEHQFAGVLVLQNTQRDGQTAQCLLHRCLWSPEIDPHLKANTFHEYARQAKIDNVEVCLQPGDLYFFNTRCIHEVPGVAGDLPRIVLATFIGYSEQREEIFVWS